MNYKAHSCHPYIASILVIIPGVSGSETKLSSDLNKYMGRGKKGDFFTLPGQKLQAYERPVA